MDLFGVDTPDDIVILETASRLGNEEYKER